MRSRGLTLTEVLVVVAIIAIVASIIFPAGSMGIAKAHETGCVSNVHQLAVAMQLYREDQGEYPFLADNGGLDRMYLGNTHLKCPDAPPQASASYGLTGGDPEWLLSLVDPPAVVAEKRKEWSDCVEKRGGDFPIVDDPNHESALQAARYGRAFAILGRENGQVATIDYRKFSSMALGSTPAPCTLSLGDMNL